MPDAFHDKNPFKIFTSVFSLQEMILQQLCQNSHRSNFILNFKRLDKFFRFNLWKKQEDKTADYEVLFTVCVLNTIVLTKKSSAISDPAFSRLKFLISYLRPYLIRLSRLLKLSVESHESLLYRHVSAIFVTHTYQRVAYSAIPGLAKFKHLKLVPYYFFNFRRPNPRNPTMPAPKRSIMTSSGIGTRLIVKMLKLKAFAS